MNQYGPAIVLGCLIGAAILLDDVITPSVPTRLMSIEAREVSTLHTEPHVRLHTEPHVTLHTEPHVRMSIQKSKANAAATSKDIEIVVITDQAPVGEDDHSAVNIGGLATAEIADAVIAIVDKAREDGTPLSPDALKAAVMASMNSVEPNSAIEVNIDVEQAPRP
ncbi:MAG: hypothetical protein HOM67_06385 [Halieaceae bacterium]|jgi:hypothetical protein|nr:hypothetical protein [Halieaceae bacterium]